MKILTPWLRSYLPVLNVDDQELAEALTLRGVAVEGVFELGTAQTEGGAGDTEGALYDMDITTNRVDAMNHYGVAREAAAIYNVPLPPLETTLPAPAGDETYPVQIDAPEACGRFTAQVIRGVTVKPSEGKLAVYFDLLGQKRISNAVDITNLVLLGTGSPTHAYDLDKLEGGIIVRQAHAGEQIRLLDGSTRTLTVDDLVVADERKALGLAGVMGGWDSMITAETRNILVEAAWFAPAAIRASSRRHLIHTDASHRFERGADFAAAPVANALVTREILLACGGHLAGPMAEVIIPRWAEETIGRPPITLSVSRVQRLLGATLDPAGITSALIERFLSALGCTLEPVSDDEFAVRLPSWRLDLTREIDLVEEIARVYGYNGFQNTLPTPGTVVAHPQARALAAVRERLLALGFTEALSSTFASAAECAAFAPALGAVALENPLSEEAANLRPSLLPGMVSMVALNLTRDVRAAKLFEIGTVFNSSAEQVGEAISLSLGLTGAMPATPLAKAADAPFYALKGAIESLLSLFETPAPEFTAEGVPSAFEPGRAATLRLGSASVAAWGELASAETSRRKLRQPVFVASVDLQALLKLPPRRTVAREISRYQAVERDFSFTFAESIVWGAGGVGAGLAWPAGPDQCAAR